jgi:tetratricopeptide (TPR) repeat protein
MDYSVLILAITEIKQLEERDAFAEALNRYESLLTQDPDQEQRLIIALGKATTLVTMKEPHFALAVLEQVSFDEHDRSVSAIAYNVRASALQQCEQFDDALSDATHARRLAESAVEIDSEIIGESIASEGFAMAGLGKLEEAIERFDLAETMALPSDIHTSIQLFRNYCQERAISMRADAYNPRAKPNWRSNKLLARILGRK